MLSLIPEQGLPISEVPLVTAVLAIGSFMTCKVVLVHQLSACQLHWCLLCACLASHAPGAPSLDFRRADVNFSHAWEFLQDTLSWPAWCNMCHYQLLEAI